MPTTARLLTALAATFLALDDRAAHADEAPIPLADLPKAVSDAVKKRFPKATPTEAAKETDGDKTEYEVTLQEGKTKTDVMLTPAGAITLIEKSIAVADLPKAVAATLAADYPKGVLKTAEEVTLVKDGQESIDYYEVYVVAADMPTDFEVKVTAAGKVKEAEAKKRGRKE